MQYEIILTSAFKKQLKTIKKRSKDLAKLTKVVNALSSGKELEPKYRDHALETNLRFRNCRECHIEPDWLLVYRIDNKEQIISLIETGSHSDLF